MENTNTQGRLRWLLFGAAVGGLLAFFFDPQSGRRRRARGLEKSMHFKNEAVWYGSKYFRHARNLLTGTYYEIAARFSQEEPVDDETLVQRVRSEMGRKVNHPRSVEILADKGKIILRGHILANEVETLFDTIRHVKGVRRVVNELEVHDTPTHVPSLQGEGKAYLKH